MTDTPTASATPAAIPAATPATPGPAAAPSGTAPAPVGDAQKAQGAPDDVSFVSTDLNTLPPQVRAIVEKINADMVRGFKDKTQKLAEERKSFEEHVRKAEMLDQILQDPQIAGYLRGQNGQNGKAETQTPQEQAASDLGITPEQLAEAQMDPAKFADLVAKIAEQRTAHLAQKQAEIEQRQKQAEALDVINAFAEATDDQGNKLHADFELLDELGLIQFFSDRMPTKGEGPKAWSAQITKVYEAAKKLYQSIYDKGKNEAMGIINQKAAQTTEMPGVAAGQSYSGSDARKLSVREAMLLAKKGVRVQDPSPY